MRVLLTIPHFYKPSADAPYGSRDQNHAKRVACLTACINSLRVTFGGEQGLLLDQGRILRRTNRALACDVDIVVCTTGNDDLLARLNVPSGSFRHHRTDAQPDLLGFECHAVLRDNLGRYDHYGYLEDDILISDPLLFIKQDWFRSQAGNDSVLQPNRFEGSAKASIGKLYLDCNLIDSGISPRYQDRSDRPRLEYSLMGRNFVFQRVDNPHSGCFFLSAEQMACWAARPYFLDRDCGFWGPLESAATLGIMRTFRLYKPARECAAFLEVRHLDNRYLENRWSASSCTIQD